MTFASAQKVRDGALVRRFGGPVRYTAIGEGTVTVSAIFEKPTIPSTVGARAASGTIPMLSLLRSEVPDLKKGDLFEVDGVDYRSKQSTPDEGEVVTVKLEVLK